MGLKAAVRSRYVVAPVILLVVAGLVAGILTGAFAALGRRGLYATGLLSDGGASTVPPSVFAPSSTSHRPEPTPGRGSRRRPRPCRRSG